MCADFTDAETMTTKESKVCCKSLFLLCRANTQRGRQDIMIWLIKYAMVLGLTLCLLAYIAISIANLKALAEDVEDVMEAADQAATEEAHAEAVYSSSP